MSAEREVRAPMSANFSVLSPKDRERLKRQIEQDQMRLRGEIVVPSFGHIKEGKPERQMGRYQQFMDKNVQEDPGAIIDRMRKYQNALKAGTPRDLDKKERLKLEKQALKDREWLRKNMCPKPLYFMRERDRNGNPNPDFQRAVEAAKIERTPAFRAVSSRYKQAMRQLDTQTPDASSVEKLRPN